MLKEQNPEIFVVSGPRDSSIQISPRWSFSSQKFWSMGPTTASASECKMSKLPLDKQCLKSLWITSEPNRFQLEVTRIPRIKDDPSCSDSPNLSIAQLAHLVSTKFRPYPGSFESMIEESPQHCIFFLHQSSWPNCWCMLPVFHFSSQKVRNNSFAYMVVS